MNGAERRIIVKPHWRAFGVWYLAMLLFGLGPIDNPKWFLALWQSLVVTGLIGAGVVYQAVTSQLTVTAEKITRSGGLLAPRTRSMPTAELDHVRVLTGLIHKTLGVGVLVLVPKGEGEIIKFWGAANPKKIKADIERLAGLSHAV